MIQDLVQSIDSRIGTFLLGALLLLFGRRLYAVLLALAGFVLGWWIAAEIGLAGVVFPDHLPREALLAGGIFGVLFAFVAFFVQRVVLGAAGFALGALAALWAIHYFPLDFVGLEWIGVLVAGVIGAVAMPSVFGLALTVLSSFAGAALIVQTLDLREGTAIVLTGLLVLMGLVFQSSSSERRQRKRRKRRRGQARRARIEDVSQ